MNLIFRLLLLFLRKQFTVGTSHPLEVSEINFFVMPHDCDFHMHLTNSRYASFCDLARISAMFDQGVFLKLVKQGYAPVLTSQEVLNFKEIAPLKSFRVASRVLGWDDKYWYFEHDFYQSGSLRARALAKGVFVRRKKMVSFSKIIEIAGHSLDSPELPDYAKEWAKHTTSIYDTWRVEQKKV